MVLGMLQRAKIYVDHFNHVIHVVNCTTLTLKTCQIYEKLNVSIFMRILRQIP